MCEQRALYFCVEPARITTLGLPLFGHPDLTMAVPTAEETDEVKGILYNLSTYVISTGNRLRPGEVLGFRGRNLQICVGVDGLLQVRDTSPSAATPDRSGPDDEISSLRSAHEVVAMTANAPA
jgi:hypothetical protein